MKMKKTFSKRIRNVLIAAVLITVVLAVAANALDTDIPGVIVKTVIRPLRSGAQALTNAAEDVYSYMFRYESLVAENKALKERIAQMEDDARTADALKRENERLRDSQNLTKANTDYVLLDTYIIGWNPTDWSSSFTIDKGSFSGVEEGMCVITANGEVVGLVVEAGPNYAEVKTVLDSSLEISAVIAASGYSGMVQGAYATGEEGMLRMNYLPSNSIIRNNDQVVTAGSTVYPKDLILGYVVDAGYDETGVAKFAILEPAADFGALEQVFVLTEYGVEIPEKPEEAVPETTAPPEETSAPTAPAAPEE